MKTRILTAIALLCPLLSLQGCRTCCPDEHKTTKGGQIGPQPGGDLVINLNPSGSGYGPTFAVGYVHGGNEGTLNNEVHYDFEIAPPAGYDLRVGKVGGNFATLTHGQEYSIDVSNLGSDGTATITNKATGTTSTMDVGGVSTDYKSPAFGILFRKQQDGSSNYTRVVVVKNTSALFFDVIRAP